MNRHDESEEMYKGTSPFGNAYYALSMAEGILQLMTEAIQYMKYDLADAHNDYIDSQHFVGSVEAGIESLDGSDDTASDK